jgi:HlyD family secretion protein
VHVAVGDKVSAGDPLIDIRPDPTPLERAEAQRQLEIARVTEQAAEREMDRARDLSQKGLVSDSERERIERDYNSAHLRAELEMERLQLLKEGRAKLEGAEVSNRISSPVDGTILTCEVHPGDPVVPLTSYQEGTVLITMADMSGLLFRGTVDEVDVGKLTVGQPVRFTIGAIPDVEVGGVLSRISPKARKQESATLFDIEAAVTKTAGKTLRAGYSANARIAIARAESVLVIPERVVKYKEGSATVRILDKNGKPLERAIETGLSDGLTVEIKNGLTEADSVLERTKSPREEVAGAERVLGINATTIAV